MRVLVTGSTGWIGGIVMQQLRHQGHEAVGYNRNWGLTWEDKFEVMIHLGWEMQDKSLQGQKTCLIDQLKFFDRMSGIVKKVVAAGSDQEYLHQPTPLGAAKRALHEMLKAYPFDLNWCQIAHCYGPGQKSTCLIPSLLRGEQPKTPDAWHDFIHVADAAAGLVELATNCIYQQNPRTYTFGTGFQVKVSGVADAINHDGRIDITAIRNGFAPTTTKFARSLSAGLQQLLDGTPMANELKGY